MSYLVPTGRLSEGERQAVRDVGAMMEQGDEDRADEELRQRDNAVEDADAAFDPASGSESPSTLRIIDQWNENRQRGADASDFYLAETDAAETLLAEHTDDPAAREAKAAASVAKILNAGVVRHADGDEEPAVSPDDYEAFDRECRSDFPDYAEPIQKPAPPPAPAEDGADGWDGPPRDPMPRRASEAPSFTP